MVPNPIKMDDLGGNTPIFGNTQLTAQIPPIDLQSQSWGPFLQKHNWPAWGNRIRHVVRQWYPPWNEQFAPWKWGTPGKGDSYWKPPFLGAMLVLGRVIPEKHGGYLRGLVFLACFVTFWRLPNLETLVLEIEASFWREAANQGLTVQLERIQLPISVMLS